MEVGNISKGDLTAWKLMRAHFDIYDSISKPKYLETAKFMLKLKTA